MRIEKIVTKEKKSEQKYYKILENRNTFSKFSVAPDEKKYKYINCTEHISRF